MSGYVYVWEYTVEAEHAAAFESAYGSDGDWVRLFRRASGYLRTELYRDRLAAGRYVTIDHWDSHRAWLRFREDMAEEFESLDARCERLTVGERELGTLAPVT